MRSTRLASIVQYECDGRHDGEHRNRFLASTILATTLGQWKFLSEAAQGTVDASSAVLANPGDVYRCRHSWSHANRLVAVSLHPSAIDGEITLFSQRIIGSGDVRRLLPRALHAETDDAFDSIAFTMFSKASEVSIQSKRIASRLRMERGKRFIEGHAFGQLKLCDLAAELGLSPFTTIRQFKKLTGQTPHAYQLEVRLNAAKRLLQKTDTSVESIAKDLGFEDLAYFSRFFKLRTGMPPSAYRAKCAA